MAEASSVAANYSDEIKGKLIELKENNPDYEYLVLHNSADNEEKLKKLKNYRPDLIESIEVKEDGTMVLILRQDNDELHELVELQNNDSNSGALTLIDE